MSEPLRETFFAPAELAATEELEAQHRKLAANVVLMTLLDSFPEPAAILNQQRQIALANDKLAALTGRAREDLIGLRIGEALCCGHFASAPVGCGTNSSCKLCGVTTAIINSLSSAEPNVQDCRLMAAIAVDTSAQDLRVWATPLTLDGESFTVFAMRDTADEKRRQVLERLFFHDVMNTANALTGMLEMWPQLSGLEAVEVSSRARALAAQLVEEIQSQRDLAAAEHGDLEVHIAPLDAARLLQRLCTLYRYDSAAEGKRIALQGLGGGAACSSDEKLLARVLGNLIKNALEASQPGQTVTVSYQNDGTPTFRVHNESAMPEDVQAQVFQRSFSTKTDAGHGVGTYSVKLLTERYLNGTVEFSSAPADGTTFTVRLPQCRHDG